MKIKLLITIFLTLITLTGFSQIKYFGKVETGYLINRQTLINVDPGPNWKGYNLNKGQNGVDINITNGVSLKNQLFAGLGIGYLNFEGINGVLFFIEFEYLPLKTKLTPLIDLRIGHNHIWNQYDNGSGSLLAEFGIGLNYGFTDTLSVYCQSGFLLTQQCFFIPIRVGLKF